MIREDEATKLRTKVIKLQKQLKDAVRDNNLAIGYISDSFVKRIDYDTIVSLIQEARTAILNIKDRLKVIETKLGIK
jgi:hypothetical protein